MLSVASTACIYHYPGSIDRHDSLPHSMWLKGHCVRPPQYTFAAYSQHPGSSSSCLPHIMCQQSAAGSLHSILADVDSQAMAPGEGMLQHECYRAADEPTARAHLQEAARNGVDCVLLGTPQEESSSSHLRAGWSSTPTVHILLQCIHQCKAVLQMCGDSSPWLQGEIKHCSSNALHLKVHRHGCCNMSF